MKSLLRKIILAVALCAVAGLGLADDKTKLLLDEVTRRVKQADAIEIDDLSQEVTVESGVLKDGVMVWTEEPRLARRASLTKKEDIERFVSYLILTDEHLRPGEEVITQDGKKMIGYPHCLCKGDFACRFMRQKEELLRFTILHEGESIRIKSGSLAGELDIVPPSGVRLFQQIKAALKLANQSPKPVDQ